MNQNSRQLMNEIKINDLTSQLFKDHDFQTSSYNLEDYSGIFNKIGEFLILYQWMENVIFHEVCIILDLKLEIGIALFSKNSMSTNINIIKSNINTEDNSMNLNREMNDMLDLLLKFHELRNKIIHSTHSILDIFSNNPKLSRTKYRKNEIEEEEYDEKDYKQILDYSRMLSDFVNRFIPLYNHNFFNNAQYTLPHYVTKELEIHYQREP